MTVSYKFVILCCLSCRGPSFISYLDELPSLTRRTDLPLRMPIVDKYKVISNMLAGMAMRA